MTTSVEKSLISFFENRRDERPDMKALATALRENSKNSVPLPPGFAITLAEIIDSRLPAKLASNWTIAPVWTGRRDDEMRLHEIGIEVEKAKARGKSLSHASPEIARNVGICDRKFWKLWKILKYRRAWWKRVRLVQK